MKRRLIIITIVTVSAMIITCACAFACTGLYIGKNVSKEGTTVIARSEDQDTINYEKMFKVKDAVTQAGRYYVDTGKGQKGFKVPLPETTYKYTYVPDNSKEYDGEYPASCTNEYGLAVIGTISAYPSKQYLKYDKFKSNGSGLREAILPGLLACQCKTADEAVAKLASLIDQYGSVEGNILFFADKTDAWIFEIYGGHQYCAMKMPADKVAVFGNQFMIGRVDKNDTSNYVFSKDLFSTLDKAGAVKENGEYNLTKSVSKTRKGDDSSSMRTWIGHKLLASSTAGKYKGTKWYPLFYKPDKKVSVLDVMQVYRNRYEGTKYTMNKAKNKKYYEIGNRYVSDAHIIQVYNNLPQDSCLVQWLCLGNVEHSVFIPAFSGITDTYKGYKVDAYKSNSASLYWDFKRNCNLAANDRKHLSNGIRSYWRSQEKSMYAQMNKDMSTVISEYAKSQADGRAYVTTLGENYAQQQVTAANKMYKKIKAIEKYNKSHSHKKTFKAGSMS